MGIWSCGGGRGETLEGDGKGERTDKNGRRRRQGGGGERSEKGGSDSNLKWRERDKIVIDFGRCVEF